MEKRRSRTSNCSLTKVEGFYRKEPDFCEPCIVKEQEAIDTNCSKRPSSWIHKEKNKKSQ